MIDEDELEEDETPMTIEIIPQCEYDFISGFG